MPDIDGLRVHGDDDHAREHLDGVCEECGTNHRVLESLPNQPLDVEHFETIESRDGIVLARSIVAVPGEIVGADAEKVCEDAVIATTKSVRTLSRYQEAGGWVVKQELDVPEDRSAVTFAIDVYSELAGEFAHVEEDEIERSDLIQG